MRPPRSKARNCAAGRLRQARLRRAPAVPRLLHRAGAVLRRGGRRAPDVTPAEGGGRRKRLRHGRPAPCGRARPRRSGGPNARPAPAKRPRGPRPMAVRPPRPRASKIRLQPGRWEKGVCGGKQAPYSPARRSVRPAGRPNRRAARGRAPVPANASPERIARPRLHGRSAMPPSQAKPSVRPSGPRVDADAAPRTCCAGRLPHAACPAGKNDKTGSGLRRARKHITP